MDSPAEAYGRERGIPVLTVKPAYERYGHAAPVVRDKEMVNMADRVLVVRDGVSRGSQHTADYARKRGKELILLSV